MVPTVGFELTTYRLQGGCSTPELCGHGATNDCFLRSTDCHSAGLFGAVERSRTSDLLITNQLLYQLSYNSTACHGKREIIAHRAILTKSEGGKNRLPGRWQGQLILQEISVKTTVSAKILPASTRFGAARRVRFG